jgi:hypothetical protein
MVRIASIALATVAVALAAHEAPAQSPILVDRAAGTVETADPVLLARTPNRAIAPQARLGNNPNNQGRNHADQQRVGSQLRGSPVAPSITGRGMGGGPMNGSMRGRR